MIDELLGRASLKARIDELEEENERLRRRFEAESERRSTAVTARQEAEREQNRLEDRIAQLEGELERRENERAGSADDSTSVEPRRRDWIRGERLRAVLDRLESVRTGPEGALTAVVSTEEVDVQRLPGDLTDVLGAQPTVLEDRSPCVVCADDANLLSVVLSPPVPPTATAASGVELEWSDRFHLEREWFLPQGRFTLALVRADLFALGVYDGSDRVDYHGFESDVKGNHSKGGFSQGRFERIREGQIADHLERSREALATRADGPLYLAGQQEAVDRLVDRVDPAATAAVDATGEPKSALDDAFRSFFTTELVVL